jgi:transcriptional regulator with XRE-family HTH domain
MTRLEQFITEWGVMPSAFARKAGISRQHLLRIRKGTADPTREVMCGLALAASVMRNRRVFIVEMFELTESEQLAHGLLISAKMVLFTMPTMPIDPPTPRTRRRSR